MITVGKRKKWRVDLLSGHSAALVFLSVLFLLGSVAGCVGAGLFQDEQGLVRSGVSSALSSAAQPGLWACVRCSGGFCLVAFALCFTAFGMIGLPVLFVCRGFLLCYAMGVFYHLWGFSGLIFSLVLYGLPALFWLPALFALGEQGLPAAYVLLRRRLGKGKIVSPYGRKFWPLCAVCTVLILLCIWVEYTWVPVLLRMINEALALF